jgi:hypothetical protein
MLSALSPCISFVLILLIGRASSFSWRESILAAAVIWGLLLTIITEALSAFEALSYLTILVSWLLSGVVLAVLYLCFVRGKWVTSGGVPSVASLPLSLLLSIGFIVSVTGLIAIVAPPNNWDSMTYHMGRVTHWIQNHGVQHYPTNIDRQLYSPPWAEFAITHLYVLNGGDRLANAIQWLSMLGSIIGVSLIAKQLGGSKESQILAALVAVCLPMGILQASSTQTDYVVTFWLVCFVFYVLLILELIKTQLTFWPPTILAGISLGLALLTKPTAYLLAPPFLVWLTVAVVQKFGGRSLKIVLAISVMAVVINLGHYVRNFEVFGSPLAPPSRISALTNASRDPTFLVSKLISNFIRNTGLEMGTPFYYGNRIVEIAVEKIETMLGLQEEGRDFRIGPLQNHEDFAGNLIHLLLIALSGVVLLGAAKRGRASIIQWYVLSLGAGYIVLCISLRWNIWITRLHLPLLVLWSSAIAIALSEPVLARARKYVIVLFVVTSQFALFYNESRPLIGARSIFTVPRLEQYFRNKPDLQAPYTYAATLVQDKRCAEIGLWLGGNTWEYPLWILLNVGGTDGVRVEHVRVSNQSARASLHGGVNNFVPCAIVAVETAERPSQITEADRTYSKIWSTIVSVMRNMDTEVAVYELEKDHP